MFVFLLELGSGGHPANWVRMFSVFCRESLRPRHKQQQSRQLWSRAKKYPAYPAPTVRPRVFAQPFLQRSKCLRVAAMGIFLRRAF